MLPPKGQQGIQQALKVFPKNLKSYPGHHDARGKIAGTKMSRGCKVTTQVTQQLLDVIMSSPLLASGCCAVTTTAVSGASPLILSLVMRRRARGTCRGGESGLHGERILASTLRQWRGSRSCGILCGGTTSKQTNLGMMHTQGRTTRPSWTSICQHRPHSSECPCWRATVVHPVDLKKAHCLNSVLCEGIHYLRLFLVR